MNKKLLFLIGIVIITIFFAITSAILTKPESKLNNKTTGPTLVPIGRVNIPSDRIINPLQRVALWQTSEDEVLTIPGIELVKTRGDTKTYSHPSTITSRPHLIITKEQVAIAERLVLPAYEQQKGYETLVEIIKRFGNPDEIIPGSFYGPYTDRYLYTHKGAVFIVNKNTNEVLEITHFAPMSIGEYKKAFPEESSPIKSVEEKH